MGEKRKKAAAAVMGTMLAVSSVPPLAMAEAEEAVEKTFDFGTAASPVKEGAVQVTEQSSYDGSAGFGFEDAASLSSIDRTGDDPLKSDFVRPALPSFRWTCRMAITP